MALPIKRPKAKTSRSLSGGWFPPHATLNPFARIILLLACGGVTVPGFCYFSWGGGGVGGWGVFATLYNILHKDVEEENLSQASSLSRPCPTHVPQKPSKS